MKVRLEIEELKKKKQKKKQKKQKKQKKKKLGLKGELKKENEFWVE